MQVEEYFFIDHFGTTLRAFPALFSAIGSVVSRIDARPQGRGLWEFLAVVAVTIAVAAGTGYATTAVAARLLPGVPPSGGAAGIGEVLRRAIANLAGFGLFWLVTAVAARSFFDGGEMQATVGRWLLMSAAQFGFFCTVFLIWFRPKEAAYRIVPLEERDARLAMQLFLVMLAVVALRSWVFLLVADGQPEPVISAGLLINSGLFFSTFFLAAWPARGAVARWIENAATNARASRFRRWLALHWLTIAGIGVVLISVVHALGAVSGRIGVVAGLSGTIEMVLLMILLSALIEFIGRRSERPDTQALRQTIPKLPRLASQMLRVLVLLVAAIYFIRLWFVDVLQVMTPGEWTEMASFAFEPLVALLGGYLAIAYVNFLCDRFLAIHPVSLAVGSDNGGVIKKADDSSRLRTLIPILRVTAIVIIVVMIGLLTLSHLGFNITPLLAGASVIGLAISFGSQALVKDIVSGILFLAEDSFRLGEYIECGNATGTVEGFTLRSVRLRHQDGQIYTVPFGQMGEITNFSRDWSTVTFTMSLDRDADLDDVRSVARRVAEDLKAEFKERLLEPLKVQGVKDVTDTAVLVQFRFKSLPRDPGEIERAARSRLLKAFKEEGISLSRHPWFAARAGSPA
jgi:small-conductance mechanosensitive channel